MLKRLGKIVMALFPSALPQSDAGFANWAAEVLDIAGLPVNDSFVSALGTQILHLKPTVAYKAKVYFILSLKKSIANQCAFNFIESARKAERDLKTVQATSDQVVQQT